MRITAAALTLAFVLGAADFAGAQQRAPIPIILPAPPPAVNHQTSSTLFDAMLAISRAQQNNPQAAQTAAFQYFTAVQQYRSGNFNAAQRSALEALSTASQPAPGIDPHAPPAPILPPGATQLPGTQGGLYGADAAAIDADTFLALARRTIDECAARHDRRLGQAQLQYADAARAFAARNWEQTRRAAKAAIDACAKSQ